MRTLSKGPNTVAILRALASISAGSSRVQEKAVQEFEREDFVDFRGVVPVSFEVAPYDALDPVAFEVWTGKCPRI